jgi:hypothetical protein
MKRQVLVCAAALLPLVLSASPATGISAVDGTRPNGAVQGQADPDSKRVMKKPPSASAPSVVPQPCPTPTEGQAVACTEVGASSRSTVRRPAESQVVVPVPSWCFENPGQGIFAGSRTTACETKPGTLTVTRVVNGVITVVGFMEFNIISYAYSSATLPAWGHQVQISPYLITGEAVGSSAQGSAACVGPCTVSTNAFPSQPVPLNATASGDGGFTTTSTAIAAIGTGTTTWTWSFTNPAWGRSTSGTTSMSEIRCDNAVGGFPRNVGCVVPWYVDPLVYSQARAPGLASHILRAQGSGLPGGPFSTPLTRASTAVRGRNNRLACRDAPRIPALSCDEYPLASSQQGLTAGGRRRTFGGCSFNLPRATGPTGVSVCMISADDQSYQGGVTSGFYRRGRILIGDPFTVVIGP